MQCAGFGDETDVTGALRTDRGSRSGRRLRGGLREASRAAALLLCFYGRLCGSPSVSAARIGACDAGGLCSLVGHHPGPTLQKSSLQSKGGAPDGLRVQAPRSEVGRPSKWKALGFPSHRAGAWQPTASP